MTSPVRALWDAPAAYPPPPRRVWRDWVLVAVLPALILLEAALRTEAPWRWLWAIVFAALVPTLLWRRSHPLPMLLIAFATGTTIGLIRGGEPDLFATAWALILVYALMRWATGRAMIIGGAILLAGVLASFLSATPSAGDAIGGVAVLVATSTLGVTFRWRADARARELESMRLQERAQLARDLHDTVAHHVSAIAIQAQAGTAVAAQDPAAAVEVLRVIEGEASRTLDEMRSMVRLLRRDDTAAEVAPQPGIGDLERLALPAGGTVVAVQVDGDPGSVPPPIAAAVFRIAQEAVTNARRHARGATGIDVRAQIDAAGIRLDVRDDGEPVASSDAGFGITGMIERATLLGGSCEAGPLPGGGWAVTVTLPRNRWST